MHYLILFVRQVLSATLFAIISGTLPHHLFAQDLPFEIETNKPYTYVPHELLPDSVKNDSAWRQVLQDEIIFDREVRYIFRVYWHTDLLDTGSKSMEFDIIRNPNEVETVKFNRVEYQHDPRDVGIYRYDLFEPEGYGFGTGTAMFIDMSQDISIPQTDSIYVGHLYGMPSHYWIAEGPPGQRRWGYFIQYVHPVHHPPVSGVSDPNRLDDPKTFPNPATSSVQIELPAQWAGQAGALTTYDMLGREVAQDSVRFAGEQHTMQVEALPPGRYLTRMRREGSEEWVTFSFVKQ